MITLHLAGNDACDQIWPLLRDTFRSGDTYAVDPDISKAAACADWITHSAVCYVAKQQGQVVATYYIKTNRQGGGAHVCNCGYIVSPALRGQGLATRLCRHSQDIARDLGYRAMQFNFVLDSNKTALRLWQHLGFTICGTIPQAYLHPAYGYVDAHILHKSLID